MTEILWCLQLKHDEMATSGAAHKKKHPVPTPLHTFFSQNLRGLIPTHRTHTSWHSSSEGKPIFYSTPTVGGLTCHKKK
jgi:hypothetical protein